MPIAAHERAMQVALEQARLAAALGEVPVGAVLTDAAGNILSCGHNRTISASDPSAHAEIVVLRAAAAKLGNYRLPGTHLYVTLEPCLMCLGALFHARVAQIVFGASDPKTGACGGHIDLGKQTGLNHHASIHGGVLQQACSELLSDFFRARRRAL